MSALTFTTQMLRLMGIFALTEYAEQWKKSAEFHAKQATMYQTLARRARSELSRRKRK